MITNFSPNTTAKDIFIAFKGILSPGSWFEGNAVKKLEQNLAEYLEVEAGIYTFDSARTALYQALKAFNIREGDEVILQAFTCVVVPNAIKYAGAKPIYVDINENTYNLDAKNLEKHINKNTKAIIIQHSFGFAADLDAILKIARKHKLKVIEDCAHSLGAEYKGQKLGTFADAAIFSFGVDKVISSVRGGALWLKNKKNQQKMEKLNLPHLPRKILMKHLLHPMIFAVGKRFYGFLSLGKILLFLSKKLGITARVIENKEKSGKKVNWFPAKMPNVLAKIALNQLKQIDDFNQHRQAIASFYKENLPSNYKSPKILKNSSAIYLRYPLRTKNIKKLKQKAKNAGVLLGDWYDTPVAPKDIDLKAVNYKAKTCPVAEKVCKEVFNLPTHRGINLGKAKKIIDLL